LTRLSPKLLDFRASLATHFVKTRHVGHGGHSSNGAGFVFGLDYIALTKQIRKMG
jgi:hypothetical protein